MGGGGKRGTCIEIILYYGIIQYIIRIIRNTSDFSPYYNTLCPTLLLECSVLIGTWTTSVVRWGDGGAVVLWQRHARFFSDMGIQILR